MDGAYETRMGTREINTKIRQGTLKERGHLEDLWVGGEIILKWLLQKWNGDMWTGLT